MHPLNKLLARNKGRGAFRVEAKATADAATIYLYDAIVNSAEEAEWFGGVAPISFIEQLAGITAGTIHLRVNSPGGSVFAARAIEQALREHPAHIVAHIDGYAASAASFLVMAADDIIMAPGAMIMIHKAWTIAWGNADDLVAEAALLEKIDGTLVDTYARRTGDKASADQIRDWLAAETWFTADDALAAGLVDRIADANGAAGGQTDAAASLQAPVWDLSAYRNPPSQPAPAGSVQAPASPAHPPAIPFDRAAALRRLEVACRI